MKQVTRLQRCCWTAAKRSTGWIRSPTAQGQFPDECNKSSEHTISDWACLEDRKTCLTATLKRCCAEILHTDGRVCVCLTGSMCLYEPMCGSAVHTSFCSLTSEFWCIVVIYFSVYLLSFNVCGLLHVPKEILSVMVTMRLFFSYLYCILVYVGCCHQRHWLWNYIVANLQKAQHDCHVDTYALRKVHFSVYGKMSLQLLDGLLINL